MVGAFVCCNGLLGRPLVRIISGARTEQPRSRASLIASSPQARGDQPDESIEISVAHHAYPAPAQARGDQPEKSIAISLPCLRAPAAPAQARATPSSDCRGISTASMRAAQRTRSLRACSGAKEHFCHSPLACHAVPYFITWSVMIGARHNDLAFSCERTWRVSDQLMMVGAFVCCNGLLDDKAASCSSGVGRIGIDHVLVSLQISRNKLCKGIGNFLRRTTHITHNRRCSRAIT
jgi:hypothetical protein